MPADKVIVIGTGYVGLPAALMWARSGVKVVGVDINEGVVKALNEGTMLIEESELHELLQHPVVQANLSASLTPTEGDVFVIAVPTPVDPLRKVAVLDYVKDALTSIAPYLRAGNLVIIESTIPPRTCRDFAKPLLEQLTGLRVPEDVMLAHCPERILPGDIFREIVENERIIGGLDETSTKRATEAYRLFVTGELHETDDVAAELAKLMENAYRDINVALANEFAAICGNLDVDADRVIALANRHPRVNILKPGHCMTSRSRSTRVTCGRAPTSSTARMLWQTLRPTSSRVRFTTLGGHRTTVLRTWPASSFASLGKRTERANLLPTPNRKSSPPRIS